MPAHIDTLQLAAALKGAVTSPDKVARAMQDIVMKDTPSVSDTDKMLHALTLRIGGMLAVGLTLMTAILGLIISLK